MPSIVQFLHPGPEHTPDNPPLKNHKNWNTGNHKRKFLCCEGEYIQNGQLYSNKLMLWGEWEPMSYVQRLNQNKNKLYPLWLNTPYLSDPIPNMQGLKNTDPFIFDNKFKYLVCQQFRNKPRLKQTQLSKLDIGSLILFGAIINARKPNAFFQLDTVFVVADWVNYNPSKAKLDPPAISQNYFDIVYSKAFTNNCPDIDLRLYFGATFNSQIYDMYSFSPSKLYDGGNTGFSRIGLSNMQYINNNKSQGFKITNNLSTDLIQSFWQKITNISRRCGCVEGVRFYLGK